MRLLKFPRLSGTLITTLVLLALVFQIAPQQLPVTLYKLSMVTLAGVVGYWLDYALFPYGRPHEFLDSEGLLCGEESTLAFVCSMLRRAVIVAAAMVAIALGA